MRLREALFPADDPSLRDATEESVSALTLDDVRAYYREVFRPDLATIVVIGNITPEKARAAIEKYFGAWTATGPKPQTDLPPAPPNHAAILAVPDASRVQDNVVLAYNLGLKRSDADYYALSLGNAVLGGSFYSTRLSNDLRKNSGSGLFGRRRSGGRQDARRLFRRLCLRSGKRRQSGKHRRAGNQDHADDAGRGRRTLERQGACAAPDTLERGEHRRIAGRFLNSRENDLPLDEPTVAAKRTIELGPADIEAAFAKWMRPDDLVRITQGPPPQ